MLRAEIDAQAEIARTSSNPAAIDAALNRVEALSADLRRAERLDLLNTLRPARAGLPVADVASPALNAFFAALPKGFGAIQNTAGDVFQESQGADGGYLLPVDKRKFVSLIAPPTLMHSMCDTVFTPSNAVTLPIDSDTDWSTSLGANDVAEGAALTESKIGLGQVTATLVKAGALARVTREMLEDNTGIGEYVLGKIARKLAWRLHARCVTACLASGGKVTVAKTTGAAAGSAPDIDNILAMDVSMLDTNLANAVWLANPKLKPYLAKLVLGQVPVFMQGGTTGAGLAQGIPDRLLGRPIFFVEGLPAVGTVGDLMLCDPTSMFQVLKTQGPRLEVSTEAEFVKDTVLYRGYVRSVCVSKWAATAQRADTSAVGNVVVLATR
jgi:HK97 family phage major capsid protein